MNDKNLLENLMGIIEKENVSSVIIGIPSYINREDVEYEGEKLGKLLHEAIPNLEVAYQDEMFTTKMAHDNLIERGMRNIKSQDDQEAAKIILQEWLDKSEHGT
jgi:putative transcription antitermination factor YqgF